MEQFKGLLSIIENVFLLSILVAINTSDAFYEEDISLKTNAVLKNLNSTCNQKERYIPWYGQKYLGNDKNFLLKWLVTEDNLQIYIEAFDTRNNISWIGFGISESGHMIGSDVVTVSNAFITAKVTDRYVPWVAYPYSATPSIYPERDIQQDWKLICTTSSSSFSSFSAILTRKLDTLDNQDRVIVDKELPIIYAWGYDKSLEINHHGPSNRGSDRINFFMKDDNIYSVDNTMHKRNNSTAINNDNKYNSQLSFPPSDTDGKIDLLIKSYKLSNKTTQYICQKFDAALYYNKRVHITAIQKIYSPNNSIIHHFQLAACGNDINMPLLKQYSFDQPILSSCYLHKCNNLVYTGNPGSGDFIFPDITGFLIDKSNDRYFLLEVHIHNPLHIKDQIFLNFGVRFHITSKLRKYDATTLTLGKTDFGINPLIPSGNKQVHRQTICDSEHSLKFHGKIHLFSSVLHMHQQGRKIWSSLYKYNQVTQKVNYSNDIIINYKNYYSYHHQTFDPISINIHPGDEIHTHCIYDTSKLSHDIKFGIGSTDEMCFSFLWVYPKYALPSKSSRCGSSYASIYDNSINNTLINKLNTTLRLSILEP